MVRGLLGGDVHPEFHVAIGGWHVALASHAVMVAVGVALGALVAGRRAPACGPALIVVAGVTVAALGGAHALFRLLHGGVGGVWSGGLASTGGVAAGLGAAWLLASVVGQPVGALLDAIAPAGLAALGIGRIGCFLGGCCFGAPTAAPWGVVLPELGGPPRHPLQLYSALGDLLLAALLPARGPLPGDVARRACLGLGVLRFGLEPLRDPAATDLLPGGWMTLPQAGALLLIAGAACGLRRSGPSIRPPGHTEERLHGR